MNIETAKEIIGKYDGPKIKIMEVCGTHTHQNFRFGIRQLLSENIELISGPGCPVCVTPVSYMDEALVLSKKRNVVICTFGDLIRVPGSRGSLADARAEGAEIQVVYAPFDAVEYAAAHQDRQVVFLSVGFETTTPSICLAVQRAKEAGVHNFSILTANKTMTNVYRIFKNDVDIYLYPGHVNAITGVQELKKLAEEGISGVVAGFTSNELIAALEAAVRRSKRGESFFINCYKRVVREEGNLIAKQVMQQVMEPCDSRWRGIGVIEQSGLKLRDSYQGFDARIKFSLPDVEEREAKGCLCGEILKGACRPKECGLFGRQCTPQHPAGACMVSNEGTCSAYYQYGQ